MVNPVVACSQITCTWDQDKNINKDISLTLFVLQIFSTCGKKLIVVQIPATKPKYNA